MSLAIRAVNRHVGPAVLPNSPAFLMPPLATRYGPGPSYSTGLTGAAHVPPGLPGPIYPGKGWHVGPAVSFTPPLGYGQRGLDNPSTRVLYGNLKPDPAVQPVPMPTGEAPMFTGEAPAGPYSPEGDLSPLLKAGAMAALVGALYVALKSPATRRNKKQLSVVVPTVLTGVAAVAASTPVPLDGVLFGGIAAASWAKWAKDRGYIG